MSTQSAQQGCDVCNKSSLSLLLLRPSPIATHSDLQAPGSAATVPYDELVTPLIPAGLRDSRPVLRLLREGYVHLYIPSTKQWRTWRVTDEADMLEQSHPAFGTPSVSTACCRKGHNYSGFKLVKIPQAHELLGQSIWLAFSANLWSDKLRTQNQANPKVMVEVKLGNASAPAFKPDAISLKRHLLESNVREWRLPKVDVNLQALFSFNSLAFGDDVQHMAETLRKAAAAHPKTLGHELAVVLPDPVGYAAELNAIRLIAEKRGMQLSASDEHKLQSHFALRGLADSVADLRATNTYAPVISKREFDRITRGRPAFKGKWVSVDGATVVESDVDSRVCIRDDAIGRYWMQGREALVAEKLPEFKAKAKTEIERGYDAKASQTWVDALEEKTRKALEPYERQWLVGRDHAAVCNYFAFHFDEMDSNRACPTKRHSSGAAYAQEVSLIDGPPPKTSVELLDAYMKAYYKKPEDPEAFAVRAMAANQQALFASLTKLLTGDPNADEKSGGGMRDKSVDFIKGLLDLKGERFHVKYSWLSGMTMGFALNPAFYLPAAVGSYFALGGVEAVKARPRLAALATGAAMWCCGMDTALKTAIGQKVVRPVLLQFWIDVSEVNRAILGPGKKVEGWMGARSGGRKLVTLLTDTERVAQSGGQLDGLLASQGSADVATGRRPGAVLAGKATGAIVLDMASGLTAQQGATLFAKQVEDARKISGTVRAAIPQGAKAVTMSLDGRLAIASVIVQTIGIVNGRQAVEVANKDLEGAKGEADRAEKEKKLRDARIGYMDSLGGLVAGSLDTLRVASEAMNLQRGAAAGTIANGSIHVLKFGSTMAGVFGGALNGYVSYSKAKDAREKGVWSGVVLHAVSSGAFYGTGATAFAPVASAGLEYLVARQIGGLAVQRIAGVAAGAWVPVAGWVLLGVGIVASVGAALLEPTQIETWARQTPFGKGPDDKKFKALDEQSKALDTALGLAAAPVAAEAHAA